MYINDPHPGRGLAVPFRKRRPDISSSQSEPHRYRLPGLGRVHPSVRNHIVAMSGEFVGTFLFLFFGLSGAQVANTTPAVAGSPTSQTSGPNTSQILYICLSFGFSLAVNAWVFFRISGGLFNPAVTLGMCLIGALPWFRGLLVFIAQMLGAMAASGVVLCLFPGPLTSVTELGGGTSIVQGLFIEMFLTTELVFTIFMLAAEKHRGTFIAPVGIGLSLFVAMLTGVYYTGGSLNPARSFGPCVANAYFPSYSWIYWLGPALGAILAAGFYKFIKMLEYETANPGQDEEDERHVPDPEASPEEAKHPREYRDANGSARPQRSYNDGNNRPHSADPPHTGNHPPVEAEKPPAPQMPRSTNPTTHNDNAGSHAPASRPPATSHPPEAAPVAEHASRSPGAYHYDAAGNTVNPAYTPSGVPPPSAPASVPFVPSPVPPFPSPAAYPSGAQVGNPAAVGRGTGSGARRERSLRGSRDAGGEEGSRRSRERWSWGDGGSGRRSWGEGGGQGYVFPPSIGRV